jgi:hypothetical protein
VGGGGEVATVLLLSYVFGCPFVPPFFTLDKNFHENCKKIVIPNKNKNTINSKWKSFYLASKTVDRGTEQPRGTEGGGGYCLLEAT